jgi:hypothetical protein
MSQHNHNHSDAPDQNENNSDHLSSFSDNNVSDTEHDQAIVELNQQNDIDYSDPTDASQA